MTAKSVFENHKEEPGQCPQQRLRVMFTAADGGVGDDGPCASGEQRHRSRERHGPAFDLFHGAIVSARDPSGVLYKTDENGKRYLTLLFEPLSFLTRLR